MLPSTKVKSPPPAGIRGTFMKREGWWRAFLQTENGVSLSPFHQPLLRPPYSLQPPREKTTRPAKTYLDDVLISFTAVCRPFRGAGKG